MKKLQLSIPEPCHEDWDAMMPDDKGRFCASCQKTVVDFSNMSDRQLAEFFKKPAGSTCGRFHQDQLNRDLVLPKKRLPWVHSFFQVAWPAFVLMLKSCAQADDNLTLGKLAVAVDEKAPPPKDEYTGVVGMILSDVTPVDSTANGKKDTVQLPSKKPMPQPPVELVGEIKVDVGAVKVDSVVSIMLDSVAAESCPKETLPMDTVTIVGYPNYRKGAVVAGAVSVVRKTTVAKVDVAEKPLAALPEVKAYPNPVRAGSQLTVALPADFSLRQLNLVSASGAVVASVQSKVTASGNVLFNVPAMLAQGTYFLQVVSAKGVSKTISVLVVN